MQRCLAQNPEASVGGLHDPVDGGSHEEQDDRYPEPRDEGVVRAELVIAPTRQERNRNRHEARSQRDLTHGPRA